MIDASKHKFGSVAWQVAMIANIQEKKLNNEKLDDFEEVFLEIQFGKDIRKKLSKEDINV